MCVANTGGKIKIAWPFGCMNVTMLMLNITGNTSGKKQCETGELGRM
jgi:hypothetical protein